MSNTNSLDDEPLNFLRMQCYVESNERQESNPVLAVLASLTAGHFIVFWRWGSHAALLKLHHMGSEVSWFHSAFSMAYEGLKRRQSLSNEGPVVISLYPVTLISPAHFTPPTGSAAPESPWSGIEVNLAGLIGPLPARLFVSHE